MSDGGAMRIGDYLGHIAEAILNIETYTADLDKAGYLADRKTQDAVVRNFEVIGEACNNAAKRYPGFAAAHPEIPWSFAYEMRNALAHGYFKIDHEIVWQTIEGDLPGLTVAIKAAIDTADKV